MTRDDLADLIMSTMEEYGIDEHTEFAWALADEISRVVELKDEDDDSFED